MQMNAWYLIALVAVAFPTFWIGCLYGMARIGPWRSLALEYPAVDLPSGSTYWFVSLQSGGFTYSNCLFAIASQEYLTLKPLLPFRPFHPAITLPREAVTDVESSNGFWMFRSVSFRVLGRRLKIYGPVVSSAFWQTSE